MSKLLLGGRQVTAFCQRGIHGTLMADGQVLTTANLFPANIDLYYAPQNLRVKSVPAGLYVSAPGGMPNGFALSTFTLPAGDYVMWGPVPDGQPASFWNKFQLTLHAGSVRWFNADATVFTVAEPTTMTVNIWGVSWGGEVTVYPRLYRLGGGQLS